MRVILLQDIRSLGKKGDIKEVSEGYARNFLFPKKIAEIATVAAVDNVRAVKEKEMKEKQENTAKMRELAAALKEKKIVLKSKEKDGKLFGSISKKEIAIALTKKGYKILENNIIFKDPIKKIGEYKIEIKLTRDISTIINLKVEGEW